MNSRFRSRRMMICKHIAGIALASFCIGCHAEFIQPAKPEEALPRLEALAKKQVELRFCSQSLQVQSSELGHQYMLLFIPFGRIFLDKNDSRDWIAERAKRALVLAGYRVEESGLPYQADLIVEICPRNLRATAFDFFLVRRLVAEISFDISFQRKGDPLPLQFTVAERATQLRKFGFGPDLRAVLEEAGEKAFQRVEQQAGGKILISDL